MGLSLRTGVIAFSKLDIGFDGFVFKVVKEGVSGQSKLDIVFKVVEEGVSRQWDNILLGFAKRQGVIDGVARWAMVGERNKWKMVVRRKV